MHIMRNFCLAACLVAAVFASPNSPRRGNSPKPSDWLPIPELQSLPPVDQISYQRLENMPPQPGAALVNSIYHLAQINHDQEPTFVPSPSSIPTYILTPNGQNVSVNLNQLVNAAKQQPNFGNSEVTIIVTGMPPTSPHARKAMHQLVQAYMQRYNAEFQQQMKQQNRKNDDETNNDSNSQPSSSEEDNNQPPQSSHSSQSPQWPQAPQSPTGDVVVINLGQTLQPFKRAFMLDVEKTGAMIGDILVDLANQNNMPEEVFHIIGQGPGAHVAGAAGRRYKRQTGRSLRHITGLNPSKVYTAHPNTVTGLARGDADFVDCIHTSPYGLGTPSRNCDADFYPNGPSTTMPGTNNIVEAAMRATRYYAESVRPGNEHNFPAVRASNMQQYKNNNGYGKRVYMGYAADFDVKGDYILQVNAHSPFGKNTPATRQNSYHGEHSWEHPMNPNNPNNLNNPYDPKNPNKPNSPYNPRNPNNPHNNPLNSNRQNKNPNNLGNPNNNPNNNQPNNNNKNQNYSDYE